MTNPLLDYLKSKTSGGRLTASGVDQLKEGAEKAGDILEDLKMLPQIAGISKIKLSSFAKLSTLAGIETLPLKEIRLIDLNGIDISFVGELKQQLDLLYLENVRGIALPSHK